MEPAYEYFTASTDGGMTWSTPVRLGPNSGTMSLSEWWIDGDLAMDAGGNLYAVWDTQGSDNDIGWLSYSTDHGATWSNPIQVPPDRLRFSPRGSRCAITSPPGPNFSTTWKRPGSSMSTRSLS